MIRFLICWALIATSASAWEVESERERGNLEGGATAWERRLKDGNASVAVSGVSFSSRSHTLEVADIVPPARKKLAEVAREAGALAGCNASYFHKDFRPLGLVISGSQAVHGQERAKLLSGILAVRGGRIELVRSAAFRPGSDVSAAIQAGPWLVEDGTAIEGLDSLKRARRTIVVTDGRGRWALVATSPVTLADAAVLLASGVAVPGWPVRDALNLDGGSSTALWAATSPELLIPEYGYVRNFLLVFPK
ncbi:MAG: hypothetical protein Fur0032_11020 [Terrimicrobiaceae bacterium]